MSANCGYHTQNALHIRFGIDSVLVHYGNLMNTRLHQIKAIHINRFFKRHSYRIVTETY